ncbi:flagellar hook-length control protein FliK [Rhizobium oryziradicis]|uniref:Flagellar hook-length control protein-like C-terminal domain-containing protein n=1 Tax=Rhizobium oryziradicis TaxID=1867956 RepID=A0A1Q8ZUS3_9HYPH|nr:flagellar hook-length control protein FliK [Rhizobium oryziradicis]OLP45810.1 hypothetical protein BJF95_11910 [Rhizobium oryziradicis]
MAVTVSAPSAANIPSSYPGSRADQSQPPSGGFRSALEGTSAGRDKGKPASDDNGKSVDANRPQDRAKNEDGTNTASNKQSDDRSASVKPAETNAEAQAGGVAGSGKDSANTLAKLVAALTNTDNASVANKDVPDEVAGKTAVKQSDKAKDQISARAAEQVAEAVVGGADSAKPTIKSPLSTKAGVTDTDDGSEAAQPQKDGTAGAQDVLSLLVQAAPTQAAVLPQQVTPAADGQTKQTVGGKLKDALEAKVRNADLGKISDDAAQPTAAATPTLRSSAADALHMVTSAGQNSSGKESEKLGVADSAILRTSDIMQTVEVVDSRRIIAPVSTSNGANIAATMTGDSEWSSVLRSHAASDVDIPDRMTTDKTLNTLTIKMTPESLGTVTANLKLVDGQLTVSLVVENGTAYRKLHEDHGDLIKSLKSQGLSVDQIQISIASPEKSSSDTTQNNSQNQPNNQSLAQQNSNGQNHGGNRQQTQASFDNFGQPSGGMADDATSPGASGTGNGGSGSGQLYL